jgi:hypothetical protein
MFPDKVPGWVAQSGRDSGGTPCVVSKLVMDSIRVVCDATDDALLMKSFDCLQNTHISKVFERERRRNASSIPNVEYAQRSMAASAYFIGW